MELSARAITRLDEVGTLEGMKQKEVISRLVEAWAAVDRPCRQLLLGTLPLEYAHDAGERLADQLAQRIMDVQGPSPPSVKARAAS